MPKLKSVPAPAIDPDAELITSAELAVLYRKSEKAIHIARMKRAPWLPRPRYLGRSVLYVKSEALAMLTEEATA